MAKQEVTYDSIIKEVNSRQFAPIYYLMGEETYYIDRLSDYIAENGKSKLKDGVVEILSFLKKNKIKSKTPKFHKDS